jgi:hypothetical protein
MCIPAVITLVTPLSMRGANPAGLSHFFLKNQLLLFLLSKIANSA